MTAVWVTLWGAVGSLFRYLLANAVQGATGPRFPLGTLVVNVLGSAAIGAVMAIHAARGELDAPRRIAITAGLLGGFTTFSAFAYDTLALAERGRWLAAGANVLVTVAACLAACAAGAVVTRSALGASP